MTPIIIRGMWGLGDGIYQRPFVRHLAREWDVYLETPWPELYEDLPVRFVRGNRKLRTQQKNIARQPESRWSVAPVAMEFEVGYGRDLAAAGMTILGSMAKVLGRPDPFVFDLPPMGPSPVRVSKPIALIRPVTVRSEWANEARNPLPIYIAALVDRLMTSHHVVLVGDVVAGQEWLIGGPPHHHQTFLSGELTVNQLLALTAAADVVIGGVGWIVPASVALGVPAFIVLGGQGAYNHPNKITDPRMDLRRLGFAMPRRFCPCSMKNHSCLKTIPDLHQQFDQWWTQVQSLEGSLQAA